MAKNLSQKHQDDFQQAFTLFDIDGDGQIPTSDLGLLMELLGQNPTQAEVLEMKNQVDLDGNGSIDFPEFLQLCGKIMSDTINFEELMDGFKIFDRDGKGLISLEDFRHVMKTLGDKLDDKVIDDMIKEADTVFNCVDKNQLLNYEIFIKSMMLQQD